MNENINLVEILKDTPQGTKLYSPIFGEVFLVGINVKLNYPIQCRISSNSSSTCFTEKGLFEKNGVGECMLFPSRDQRDWSKFYPYKDGDILMVDGRAFIYRKGPIDNIIAYCGIVVEGSFIISKGGKWTIGDVSYADSIAKEDLFLKMNEAGYTWNADTKILDKNTEKTEWNFKPKDWVLVRDLPNQNWQLDIFSHYKNDEYYKYSTIRGFYKKCVPYNKETEHLLGTNLPFENY